VVNEWEEFLLRVDTTSVGVLEVVSNVHTARNWSVLEKLSLHLVSTLERVIVGDVVVGIVNCLATI